MKHHITLLNSIFLVAIVLLLTISALTTLLISLYDMASMPRLAEEGSLYLNTYSYDWDENEYELYYENNDIMPMMPADANAQLENHLAVQSYLNKYNSNYSWSYSQNNSCDLKSIYGSNPINVDEYQPWFTEAKEEADLPSQKEWAGCGVIALTEALIYYSEVLGYTSFNTYARTNMCLNSNGIDENRDINRKLLALDALQSTPSTGWWDAGTSVMPSSFLTGAKRVLKDHNLYSDDQKYIEVYGDLISRPESLSEKINTVKTAINDGQMIVWWTGTEFGDFSNHYMNIFGYEDWIGTDANGNTITKTFIVLNYNHTNRSIQYMDSDVMTGLTMGFIFFKCNSSLKNINLSPTQLNLATAYNSTETSKNVSVNNSTVPIQYSILRGAYITHYDSTNTNPNGHYLALSPNKADAGLAYIEFQLPYDIKRLDIDLSWWRAKDRYSTYQGSVTIDVYDRTSQTWITVVDVLNNSIDLSVVLYLPTKYSIPLSINTNTFRIRAVHNSPSGSSNRNRVIIHAVNAFADAD